MGLFRSSNKVEEPKFPHKTVNILQFFGYFENNLLNGQEDMVKDDEFQKFIMPHMTDDSYDRMCRLCALYEKEFSDSALEDMNDIYSNAVKAIKNEDSDFLQLIANRNHYMSVSNTMATLLGYFFSSYCHIANRVGFEVDYLDKYSGEHHTCTFKNYINYDKHWTISRSLNDLADRHNHYLFVKKKK